MIKSSSSNPQNKFLRNFTQTKQFGMHHSMTVPRRTLSRFVVERTAIRHHQQRHIHDHHDHHHHHSSFFTRSSSLRISPPISSSSFSSARHSLFSTCIHQPLRQHQENSTQNNDTNVENDKNNDGTENDDNDENDNDESLIILGSKDDPHSDDILVDETEEMSLYPVHTQPSDFMIEAVNDLDQHLSYTYNGLPIPEAPHGIKPPSLYDYKITHLLFKRIHEEPSMDFSIGTIDELSRLDNVKSSDGYPLLEVAFCGRSNVGKSSLVNAVLGHEVSKVSKTPGHTKRLNFFNVGDMVYIVDLPGYGYAEGNMDEIEKWTQVMGHYLASRGQRLKRVFVLIDTRRGLTKLDQLVLEFLTLNSVSHQIIFTKCDKVSHQELCDLMEDTYKLIDTDRRFMLCYPYITPCSSLESKGIEEVKCAIVSGSGLRMSVRLMNERQKLQTMKRDRDKMLKDLGILNPQHPVFKNQRELLEDMKKSSQQTNKDDTSPNKSATTNKSSTNNSSKKKQGGATGNKQAKSVQPAKDMPPTPKKSIVLGLYGEEDE